MSESLIKDWSSGRCTEHDFLTLCGIQAYHGSPGSLILCGFCIHWIRKTMFFGSSGTWFLELSQNTFIFLWACTDAHKTIKGVCHFPRLASSLHPGAPTGVIVAHTCRAQSSVGHDISGAYSYYVGTNIVENSHTLLACWFLDLVYVLTENEFNGPVTADSLTTYSHTYAYTYTHMPYVCPGGKSLSYQKH